MGILDFFKKDHKDNFDCYSKNDNLIEDLLNQYDFFGNYKKSNNGIFLVAFRDSYFEDDKLIKGEILLFENSKLLFRKTYARPNDALVSNDGIVIFCDWLESDELVGDFIVLDKNGNIIFKRHVLANLGICAINSDSTITLFETYLSESKDSNKIFVVDLIKKEIISSFEKEYSFKEIYFDLDNNQLILISNSDKYIYDYYGNLKNEEEIEENLFKSSKIKETILYLDKLSSINLEKYLSSPKYLTITNEINNKSRELDTWLKRDLARIYKRLGEYYEKTGDLQNVIEFFEIALSLDEKVGVKRKLEKLKS